MPQTRFQLIVFISLLLTVVVVTLGAYVRLSDAGLGCPDWPGCYGKLVGVPKGTEQIKKANEKFPERPVEGHKAWKEMIHRYFAGTLGLLVVAIAVMAWRQRRARPRPLVMSLLLVPLIVLQAALGMWTVTEKLEPFYVTAHLLMGFLTLSLLAILYFRERLQMDDGHKTRSKMHWFAMLVVVIVFGQIFLGGWTSTHYAAFICHDFPTCDGKQWLPKSNFKEAFVLYHGDDRDYEGGRLSAAAQMSVHMTHRAGALVTTVFVLLLSLLLILKEKLKVLKRLGWLLIGLLVAQLALGISVVLHARPLELAVAHNGIGALLLACVLVVTAQLRRRQPG